jgi:hypothetical protein
MPELGVLPVLDLLVHFAVPGGTAQLSVTYGLLPCMLDCTVQDVALTLLLSLRFMSLVFEEVRRLALLSTIVLLPNCFLTRLALASYLAYPAQLQLPRQTAAWPAIQLWTQCSDGAAIDVVSALCPYTLPPDPQPCARPGSERSRLEGAWLLRLHEHCGAPEHAPL